MRANTTFLSRPRNHFLLSRFRLILPGMKLLLRRQPSFEMLPSLSVENLQDDSGHSFRAHPRYLALPAPVRSLRQIKLEIHDYRVPQLSCRAPLLPPLPP